MSDSWPLRYPGYLPFPAALGRSEGPVPNRQSVDWPQSQFAPLYLPPGSASFQAYRYGRPGPLTQFRPSYYTMAADQPNVGHWKHSYVGPSGDTSQTPYGDLAFSPTDKGTIMMRRNPYAAYNPDDVVATSVPVDSSTVEVAVEQLLDAPAGSAPTEAVLPEVAAEVVTESDVQPFAPELLEGLRPRPLARIQALEKLIAKFEARDELTQLGQAAYERLCKVHERIGNRLEKRMERRAKGKGRGHKFLKHKIQMLRAKSWFKQHPNRLVSKAIKVDHIRDRYQAGEITRSQARSHIAEVVTKPTVVGTPLRPGVGSVSLSTAVEAAASGATRRTVLPGGPIDIGSRYSNIKSSR